MKRAFTIVEVSILFVIFLIVAFLVAPLSLDDTMQAKNTSRWINVQSDFANISYAVASQKLDENYNFEKAYKTVIASDLKGQVTPYRVSYLNGMYAGANDKYKFNEYYTTQSGAVVALKFFNENDNLMGILMYDVNGSTGPNVWGNDVYGLNLYKDKFEPFCKNDIITVQRKDCSKGGTGLCCSNYYLIGGSID